jgi:superfamily II DNA or RNA helicase
MPSQKSPLPFSTGDEVFARGDRWVIEATTRFHDCVLLRLTSHTDRESRAKRHASLLYPFDRPVVRRVPSGLRAVTRRRWMRRLQAELADLQKPDQLRSLQSATLEILPFQLEPALAMIRGRSSRFLLADEVGLGKTVQAVIMLAELQRRGWCERALILTPAALRHQWADELGRRVGISASIFDAFTIRSSEATLPAGVNPWSTAQVAIASVDFVKQPEVLRALTPLVWDILIIDEAHQVAMASRRYGAASTLAHRARLVVLVTATPHAGDQAAYRSLCGIGQMDQADRILRFRRTRARLGPRHRRRVHLLAVRLGPEERDLHQLLYSYVKRLWQSSSGSEGLEVRLVAMVLMKRAFSSASSLARSLRRRLTGFEACPLQPVQTGLQFGDVEEPTDADPQVAAPGFDRRRESECLNQILSAAMKSAGAESKVRVLRTLLRRIREPVIVFTEYRDTVEMLAPAVQGQRNVAVLHGGLTDVERRHAVSTFNSGEADLLLATDAGSEGLNLQSTCRLVVNLELPWNPNRLEQRIGRVDRIGQARPVHAINLLAGDTSETTVLARLLMRLDRIRSNDIEIADCVINRSRLPPTARVVTNEPAVNADFRDAADAEASRLQISRTEAAGRTRRPAASGIPATVASWRGCGFVGPTAIWFVRAQIVSGANRLVETLLVAVGIQLRGGVWTATNRLSRMRRRDAKAFATGLVSRHGPAVMTFADKEIARLVNAVSAERRQAIHRALERERWLARATAAGQASLVQAGLFDRRSLQHTEESRRSRQNVLHDSAARTAALRSEASLLTARPPELILLLIAGARGR